MVRCDGKINRGLNHYDSYSLTNISASNYQSRFILLLKLCYSKPELCRDKACKQRTEQLVEIQTPFILKSLLGDMQKSLNNNK